MHKNSFGLLIVFAFLSTNAIAQKPHQTSIKRPNIILVMADDLGWGDVAYNGNSTVKTPNLDAMAATNLQLNRFYAAAPVCSPTRGSCLTGRNSFRYGLFWADAGHLPAQEITLAEMLKENGYATGHFGKWHVGTFSQTDVGETMQGEENRLNYSPPWENGFDESFSTESLVPLYNPSQWWGGLFADPAPKDYQFIMNRPMGYNEKEKENYPWHVRYWSAVGKKAIRVDADMPGDDSKIIMDKAVDFIGRNRDNPFLSVIWFHAPHTPIATGNEHRALYPNLSIQEQHWYGCISSLDEQVGRLRKTLKELDLSENTIVWFCSDNGPSYVHNYNSAGPFRGKKGTLYEGGVRVPSIIEWPAVFKKPAVINAAMSTSDFYPTLLAAAGISLHKNQPLLDGVNVMNLLKGTKELRGQPIAFQAPVKSSTSSAMQEGSKQLALSDDRYKLFSNDNGKTYQLYDLVNDPSEQRDIALKIPKVVVKMKRVLSKWISSCDESLQGKDY